MFSEWRIMRAYHRLKGITMSPVQQQQQIILIIIITKTTTSKYRNLLKSSMIQFLNTREKEEKIPWRETKGFKVRMILDLSIKTMQIK